MVDRSGVPIAIGIASGQRHVTRLVKPTLWQRFLRALPQRCIGDKAYDNNHLDANFALMGVEMIAPHKCTRRRRRTEGHFDAIAIVGVSNDSSPGFSDFAATLLAGSDARPRSLHFSSLPAQ